MTLAYTNITVSFGDKMTALTPNYSNYIECNEPRANATLESCNYLPSLGEIYKQSIPN